MIDRSKCLIKYCTCNWLTFLSQLIPFQLVVIDVLSGQMTTIPMLQSSEESVPAQQPCGIHGIAINPSGTMLATGASNTNDIGIYKLPTFDPFCVGEVSAHKCNWFYLFSFSDWEETDSFFYSRVCFGFERRSHESNPSYSQGCLQLHMKDMEGFPNSWSSETYTWLVISAQSYYLMQRQTKLLCFDILSVVLLPLIAMWWYW